MNDFNQTVTLAAAGTSYSNVYQVDDDAQSLDALLTLSALSGTTPTLDVTIQASKDNSSWIDIGTFTQLAATGSQRKAVGDVRSFIRFKFVLAGTTPTATATIRAQAREGAVEEIDDSGNKKVVLESAIAGEDTANDVMKVEGQFDTLLCTADTLVLEGVGLLHTLTFMCNDAAPTAGSIAVYDGINASGTLIYSETFTATAFRAYSVLLDRKILTGIYVDFTTTADVNCVASYRG